MGYLRNGAIAVDQLLNVLLTNGDPDETLSSHAWRVREHKYWGWTHTAINALFFWQNNHCRGAYVSEQLRKHLAAEFQLKEMA